jgi:hypothetical protein
LRRVVSAGQHRAAASCERLDHAAIQNDAVLSDFCYVCPEPVLLK